jgi:hypothetical protein
MVFLDASIDMGILGMAQVFETGGPGSATVRLKHLQDSNSGSHVLELTCELWVYNCTGIPIAIQEVPNLPVMNASLELLESEVLTFGLWSMCCVTREGPIHFGDLMCRVWLETWENTRTLQAKIVFQDSGSLHTMEVCSRRIQKHRGNYSWPEGGTQVWRLATPIQTPGPIFWALDRCWDFKMPQV